MKTTSTFPTAISNLPASRSSEVMKLSNSGEFELRFALVKKRLGEVLAPLFRSLVIAARLGFRESTQVIEWLHDHAPLHRPVPARFSWPLTLGDSLETPAEGA
jgi:hypothetical protein